jgi:hypothetical protein
MRFDAGAVVDDAHSQRSAAHLVLEIAVVALLDRPEHIGEHDDVLVLGKRQPAQKADADAASVGMLGADGVPVSAESGAQLLERLRLPHFLDAEHVGGNHLDRCRQMVKLGVVCGLRRRSGGGARAKEVSRGSTWRRSASQLLRRREEAQQC